MEIGICLDCFMVVEMGAETQDEAILNGVARLMADGVRGQGGQDRTPAM